jgi:hypothetical protein
MFEKPSEEIFLEMRKIATEIWRTYSDEFGYVSQKLNYINSLENDGDNAMVFYRMFDFINKNTFKQMASREVLDYITENN